MGWNLLLLLSVFCLLNRSAFGGVARKKHERRLVGLPGGTAANAALPPDQWLIQRLDHSDPTNPGTWWQRYQTNDAWFKNARNSPVFLMIGGEGEASAEWLVNGAAWTIYAQKFGALCFQLEHRFYGESQPRSDLSVESLKFLSSEQALADIAYFIQSMNEKYRLSANNRWVVFGGSYSGSLAAWARLKYPHLVHAAVSTSGPLLAEANFKSYDEVVKRALAASSPKCAANVHKAALAVEDLLKTPHGPSVLSKKFNLCTELDVSNKKDVSNFAESLAGNFQGVVQYNRDNRMADPKPPSVDDLCKLMTDGDEPKLIDRYAAVNRLLTNGTCLDVKYHSYIEEMRSESYDVTAGGRPWLYQTCTEFGFYQTSSSRNEIFGSLFNLQFFIDQCKDIFDQSFDQNRLNDGIRRSNNNYGALGIAVSNVVFVQGSLDPWHVLGVTKSTNPSAPAILIDGTAHCANMYPPAPDDLPQLTAARAKIEQILGEWLSSVEPWTRSNGTAPR
ncbi:unnamed protein product [Nesidiocoris tenuis]|uniref:Serine protease K12H4.7 n=1 Tax=Nesidiocoris tenuis TaxID=355587 RepID=A0A6H5HG31_9HEMI|nr:unnamed protein product [Nesidiocoris tenuis]